MLVHISALIAQPLVAECTQALCKCGLRTLGATLQKTQTHTPPEQKLLKYTETCDKKRMSDKCAYKYLFCRTTLLKSHVRKFI